MRGLPKSFPALALVALAACHKAGTDQQQQQTVDPVCTEAKPCALVPGTPLTEKIDAVGQVDRFTVEVPASFAGKRTLLRISLTNAAPVSPVRLVFLLENQTGAGVVGTRGPVKGSGAQSLVATFLVDGPGIYPLLVRDSTNQNLDKNNPYTLAAEVFADPDASEPDDLPANARVNQPTPATATGPEVKSGTIASAGDRDLLAFELTADGLVRWTVQQGLAPGPLQLRARILKRSASAPDDLAQGTTVAETAAATPGAAVNADLVRFLSAGKYLVALEDLAGTESDERVVATWTTGLQLQVDPDPNEQVSRNDTAQTATQLGLGQTKEGAIGSQGDLDWYQIDLPAASTPQLLELRIDPKATGTELELDWAVGDVLAAPTGACDFACGPFAFCGGNQCLYQMRALHHFAHGETLPQLVRLRHLGAARTVRMVVSDQGSDARSANKYEVSATLVADPDAQEVNDTLAGGTPLAPQPLAAGAVRYTGAGKIGWWEFIDGRTTAELKADVDFYNLGLPARDPAPACPDPVDGGDDAGDDAGVSDAGPCTPTGGPTVYLPRPAYGLVAHWRGPADGVYRLGLQGNAAVDAGTACMFSFDERFAHAEGADGGYVFGNLPTDPCFCLGSGNSQADSLWLRIEAAHRPTPPDQNKKSDLPYSFTLDLTPAPGGLQTTCDGGCASLKSPNSCPGN